MKNAFYVNRELREWGALSGSRLREAVSAFGFSGTNAHLVIERSAACADLSLPAGEWHGAFLSGKTSDALRQRCADLAAFLRDSTMPSDLPSICYTLNTGCVHFENRAVFAARTVDELRFALDAWLEGRPVPALPSSLANVAARYLQGASIDWNAEYTGRRFKRVPLPAYPFARERHWRFRNGSMAAVALEWTTEEWYWRDHVIQGRRVLPGVVMLERVLEAAKAKGIGGRISDVSWVRPLIADGTILKATIQFNRHGGGTRFEILTEAQSVLCEGTIDTAIQALAPRSISNCSPAMHGRARQNRILRRPVRS